MSWTLPFLGLPFREFGRDRDGIDCWGLYRLAMAEMHQIVLPSFEPVYEMANDRAAFRTATAEAFTDGAADAFVRVETGQEAVFDAVIFRQGRYASHIGLVVGGGRMLHITSSTPSACDPYRTPELTLRLVGFYRHRELVR